jgi:hypothetical protein
VEENIRTNAINAILKELKEKDNVSSSVFSSDQIAKQIEQEVKSILISVGI